MNSRSPFSKAHLTESGTSAKAFSSLLSRATPSRAKKAGGLSAAAVMACALVACADAE